MQIPKVTVEVAFDGGPFSKAYTWTDISGYVRGFQVRRGRNSELDRIEAGTLSLSLDNSDGRFTPGKAGRPYYPNVTPRRRVRIRTSNMAPKDVSTGGDASRSGSSFRSDHIGGVYHSWATVPKSGAGSIRVQMANNGVFPFASSVLCGRFGERWQPAGVTRVAGGRTYSATAQVRLEAGSPNVSLAARIVWYDHTGTSYGSSARGASVAPSAAGWSGLPKVTATAPPEAVWAAIEVGSQEGGDNFGVFYVDEVQLEEGGTVGEWLPGGSIFHGYVEKWTVTSEGLTASADVSAVDGFGVLASTELRTATQEQILTTGPLGYWPLGEPEGSTRLANVAVEQQPARLSTSKYGGGTPRLGADSLVRNDPATSYSLANVAANQGTVVDICENGARVFPFSSDITVAFWCHPVYPSSGQMATLFRSWDENGADHLKIQINSTGKLVVAIRINDVSHTMTSTKSVSSSKPTFITVTHGWGALNAYFDGQVEASMVLPYQEWFTLRDMRWASLGGAQAGSLYQEYANGRYGHLAIWNWDIGALNIDDIWRIADYGGLDFVESENSRLARIALMAEYFGESAFDEGASLVQGPSWSPGTKALDEIQATAEDASGYSFMDGDGRLTYHNRTRRQGAGVRFELGDSLGLPYEPGLTFEMDEDRLINEVPYKRPNGAEGVVKDAVSAAAFGRKSKSIELRVSSDAAIQDAAYVLVSQYSQPIVRCDSVTLKASATPGLFLVALGVEIGDRVRLSDLPSQAPEVALDFFIEAIQTDVSVNGGTLEWETTLALSPAGPSDVWILEDSALGLLDQTTILAY
ncbi:LamG-like jellyroll fold domain-containing protein [Streptomyces sp. NPDC059534]|uniref:LamG-like jellyroll fold domain-containing protein n=1 Tax=Streptomyces sp. NPDC059534 TaxID=3346859 RepID=UPI00369017B5